MVKNTPGTIVGLVLLAGSLLLLWFVVLAGVTNTTPLDKTYYLRADTAGITGARPVSQWTYFYVCGDDNNNCSGASAAPAFGHHAWDGNPQNVPTELVGSYGGDTTSYKFYYLWRFGWVFTLMTLFFLVLAFFSGFLACCGRLGAAISGFATAVALFFFTLAAVLTTVTFVEARNQFNNAGRSAKIGSYAFGFLWAAYAMNLIATVLFCLGIRKGDTTNNVSSGSRFSRFGRFGRRSKSTRRSSYDGRRVKDDYS